MTYLGLSPREIVAELDRHIIGQDDAKKSVAIALRNRYRRKNVSPKLRDEIVPKNILMIGPTGVGKTEIARRLAKLANSPFVKVEATKFTEVGYVGRDVESMIRDLVEVAINMLKNKAYLSVQKEALTMSYERILDVLVGKTSNEETRAKFRKDLESGKLNDKEIEINIADISQRSSTSFEIPGVSGMSMGMVNIGDMLTKAIGGQKTKLKKMTVEKAVDMLQKEESQKLVDEDNIIDNAIKLTENDGIIFLDEIDKITSNSSSHSTGNPSVSREGVQRDLLPLIEGTTVSTKYGVIKTDHILFIASGAFHLSKPSDLLPELQGRMPIRVELKSLGLEEMVRILKEPESSLIEQYIALLKTEDVDVKFTEEALNQIAYIAIQCNKEIENIGARRMHTIMEKLLEEISFTVPEDTKREITITDSYVKKQLGQIIKDPDLQKFIL